MERHAHTQRMSEEQRGGDSGPEGELAAPVCSGPVVHLGLHCEQWAPSSGTCRGGQWPQFAPDSHRHRLQRVSSGTPLFASVSSPRRGRAV